jgi:hypothetical protein
MDYANRSAKSLETLLIKEQTLMKVTDLVIREPRALSDHTLFWVFWPVARLFGDCRQKRTGCSHLPERRSVQRRQPVRERSLRSRRRSPTRTEVGYRKKWDQIF